MAPSKDTVIRIFLTEGVNVGPGLMVNSLDSVNDKVEMELHPAGVRCIGKTFHCIIPYARCKSIALS
jgi:hypothetical protein